MRSSALTVFLLLTLVNQQTVEAMWASRVVPPKFWTVSLIHIHLKIVSMKTVGHKSISFFPKFNTPFTCIMVVFLSL